MTYIKIPIITVILNYFNFFFVSVGVAVCFFVKGSIIVSMVLLLAWIYLVPPILCRLTIFLTGKPSGSFHQDSNRHTLWWWLYQLQLLFSRFPVFEEILRIVPGLYALWLNLWGAKVSLFSFWSPGVTVIDRYHIWVEKGVILGTNAILSPHILIKGEDGKTLLVVDQITIKRGALIGAESKVTPGCYVREDQTLTATKSLLPYTEIRDGKKILLRNHKEYLKAS
ncbi:MAG: hypothetical protein COC09_00665 [Gammaproteobacteria bacterium]|nr:hypothetical protein [Gammaproteobacteria bacterium]PCH65015.1 MAG: hypothetical protein COC09_00665 [Gammaproteobacteria bacterium]